MKISTKLVIIIIIIKETPFILSFIGAYIPLMPVLVNKACFLKINQSAVNKGRNAVTSIPRSVQQIVQRNASFKMTSIIQSC